MWDLVLSWTKCSCGIQSVYPTLLLHLLQWFFPCLRLTMIQLKTPHERSSAVPMVAPCTKWSPLTTATISLPYLSLIQRPCREVTQWCPGVLTCACVTFVPILGCIAHPFHWTRERINLSCLRYVVPWACRDQGGYCMWQTVEVSDIKHKWGNRISCCKLLTNQKDLWYKFNKVVNGLTLRP